MVGNFDFSKILDVGVGRENLLKCLKNMGKEVLGIDYSHFSFESILPKDIKIIEAPIWDIKEITEKGFRVLRLWEHEINNISLEQFKERLYGIKVK